jgi:hypothetical protein
MSDQRVTNDVVEICDLGIVVITDEDAAAVYVALTPLHPDMADEQRLGEWSMN